MSKKKQPQVANTLPQNKNSTSATFENKFLLDISSDTKLVRQFFIGSLVLIFIAMSAMSFSYGITGDEIDTNNCGKFSLNYYKSFGADKTILTVPKTIDRDSVFRFYGGAFLMTTTLINKVSPLNQFTTEHLVNSWAGFLIILFSALIVARMLNKRAAIYCAWLLFLSPFVLGHSMNNPKDIPFAASFIIGLYCIIKFVDGFEKAKWKDYIFIILSFAISIGTRVGGILLIPLFGVYIFIKYLHTKMVLQQTYPLKKLIQAFIIVSVAGYLGCSLFWPFAMENPIANPIKALTLMSSFEIRLFQLFEGVKKYPGTFYLPLNILYTNSIALLTGIGFSILFAYTFRKHKNAPILFFIVFATLFPLVYIIYKKSVVYHAWRHILFIAPGLAIIATFGWFCFNNFLTKKFNLKIKMLGWIICIIMLLEPLIFIIRTFPNTVTYYNFFVGGISKAYANYEMDSYGNSVKQEADWFIKNELPKIKPTEKTIIASNYAQLLQEYFKPYKNIEVHYVRFSERSQQYWDYAIFHMVVNMPLEQIKNGSWISKNPLHITSVLGKPLSYSYKRTSTNDLKGYEFIKTNNADSALYYFNQFLLKEPNEIEILNNVSNIYTIQNKVEKAIPINEKCLQIDETNAGCNYVKAIILAKQNLIKESNFFMGKSQFYNRNYQEAYKAFSGSLGSKYTTEAENYITQIDEIIKNQEEFELEHTKDEEN